MKMINVFTNIYQDTDKRKVSSCLNPVKDISSAAVFCLFMLLI